MQFSYVIDVSDEFVEMCGGSARRVRAERKKVERTKMEEKEEEKVDETGLVEMMSSRRRRTRIKKERSLSSV